MNRPLVALVLAGGTGWGLYPAARRDRPKQFQAFGGDRSLLQTTVDRTSFADETYVLTRPAFADTVTAHAPDAGILTEPEHRDTGPAAVYATHRIREQLGECVIVCVPGDQFVSGEFETTVRTAAATAVDTGGLVTVGVEPTRAEPGYDYVKPGADHGGYESVEAFKEKPSVGAAERYRYHGYYWNTGIYAWTPEALLRAAADSELAPLVRALDEGEPAAGFEAVDPVSVDHAVLEQATNTYVVPADFAWDDLGSWDALERVLDQDDTDNTVLGEALTIDADGNVIASDGHVSAVGVEDLVIASFGDRTLVVPKRLSQRVHEVVQRLDDTDR